MKVLLVKCYKKTMFSRLEPIITEPLELEYLAGLLEKKDLSYRIYDQLLEGGSFAQVFQAYQPEVLVLSGYITAVDTIITYAGFAKSKRPKVKVVVGGVHAEINYVDFFVPSVDFIVHSDPISTFEKLVDIDFNLEKASHIKGVAYHTGFDWQVNEKVETRFDLFPAPNRSYFESYQRRTKYLHYSPVALVKTALSCPHKCNFCYCRLLNQGTYVVRSIEAVVEEIKGIKAEYIWIVDDSFLLDRERVLSFISEIEKQGIAKRFIAYSRVDFIAKNPDIIKKLAAIGLVELIVGMEAVEDQRLADYNKHCSANENIQAVEILKEHCIRLTALFIVGTDFSYRDFRRLSGWIRKIKLDCYTFSLFTPLKGTELYQEYESRIKTMDYSKYDFLHLTLKPSNMNSVLFYINFYSLYLEQFFRSSYIRRFVFKNILRFLKGS